MSRSAQTRKKQSEDPTQPRLTPTLVTSLPARRPGLGTPDLLGQGDGWGRRLGGAGIGRNGGVGGEDAWQIAQTIKIGG